MADKGSTRRAFLRGAAGASTVALVPRVTWAAVGSPQYIAAAGLPDGSFWLLGLTDAGTETFRLPLPARGHAAAAHPERPEAVAFARRPGTFAVVIDCAEGREIAELHSPADRHFYGHGAFSPDGTLLFTTENAISEGTGRLGIWDARSGYKRIGEISSGGSGPHEVRLVPNSMLLAVANGGIETDPTSGRSELNIATMVSNLAYVDIATGAVAQTLALPPELRLNSIRHIAAAADGTLIAGLQWQGSELEHPPLAALHRPGTDSFVLLSAEPEVQRQMRNYVGSAAITRDARYAAVSAPRGGLMLVFDLSSETVAEVVEATDLCGVAALDEGFVCSTGEGRFLTRAATSPASARESRIPGLSFDNHLVRV